MSPQSEPLDAQTLAHPERVRLLFEEHNRALVGFLTAKLHSVSEARDVAQEAYVRLLQLEKPGAVSFLRAYLYRIASNLAIDRLRQRRVREEGTPQEFLEGLLTRPSPERTVLAEQQIEVVVEALGQLSQRCREAFALHYFGDRSLQEIARQMGITDRAVQKYVARGLEHCRVQLDMAKTMPGEGS